MSETIKKISVAVLVLGIIVSIFSAYVAGTTLGGNLLSAIITFVIYIIGFVFASVFIKAYAEVLDRLEYMEYHLRNGAGFLEKIYRERAKGDTSQEKVESNYWQCDNCGRRNPPYEGICQCGSGRVITVERRTLPM